MARCFRVKEMELTSSLFILTSFASVGLTLSSTKLLGLFFVYLQNEFDADAKTVSLALGLVSSTSFLCGPLYSLLFNKLGARATTVIGILAGWLGFLLCSFMTDIKWIAIINVLLSAWAYGTCNLSFFTMTGQVYDSKLSLVNNTLGAASSVASFALAPLLQLCIDFYGWRGAMSLLAVMVLQALPTALLATRLYGTLKRRKKQKSLSNAENYLGTKSRDNDSAVARVKRLLTNRCFVTYATALTFTTTARLSVLLYTVRYAQAVGITEDKAVWIFTVQELLSIVTSPIAGYLTSPSSRSARPGKGLYDFLLNSLAKLKAVPRAYAHAFLSLLFSGTISIPLVFESYAGLLVSGVLNGIILGANTALPITVLADLFKSDGLATAQGIRCFLAGLAFIIYPLIVGTVIDSLQSYKPALVAAAACSFVSAVLTVYTQSLMKKTNQARKIYLQNGDDKNKD